MMTSGIDVGEGAARRRIAILHRAGAGPPVVWFGGFRSEMRGAKADALDTWAEAAGRAFVRFDYSGHGASGRLGPGVECICLGAPHLRTKSAEPNHGRSGPGTMQDRDPPRRRALAYINAAHHG